MSGLLGFLIPFGMPGWPPVEQPTLVHLLTIILFLPLAVGAIITLIGFTPSLRRSIAQGTPDRGGV